MANTSSTGGVLLPADTPAPAEDVDLDAIVQRLVASITALPGQLVRPRWQPNPPKQPEPAITWCAISVMSQRDDNAPYIRHNPGGEGSDTYIAHETFEALATFYGPQGQSAAAKLRDGVRIPQNVEQLRENEIAFIDSDPIRSLPELINQQWVRRYDIRLTFRRKVTRVYAIQNVLLADIHLFDDTHIDELIPVPPAP